MNGDSKNLLEMSVVKKKENQDKGRKQEQRGLISFPLHDPLSPTDVRDAFLSRLLLLQPSCSVVLTPFPFLEKVGQVATRPSKQGDADNSISLQMSSSYALPLQFELFLRSSRARKLISSL